MCLLPISANLNSSGTSIISALCGNLSGEQIIIVFLPMAQPPFPYLVLWTLDQFVDDKGSEFPLAIVVLHHQTYVDCAFSADDQILACQTRDQLIELLKKGSFRLRKWINNRSVVRFRSRRS